jgi:CRISPR system Cascade subunit CasC
MSTKNFVNFHALISHSPSCLNRDDMNMQKTAVFGGMKRVRISSQSLKRAMRRSDHYSVHLGIPSVRTRDLGKLKTRFAELLGERFEFDLIGRVLEWMSGKEGIVEGVQADAVAPWSVEEVAHFCQLIRDGEKDGVDLKRLEKQIDKDARPFREAMSKAVDIALSGRMATSGLMTNLPADGALAIAHAITTHSVEPQDVDWFTAVDDLTQDAGKTGAGHLDTQEFSAGVFYRYASLNLKQLQVNLGLLKDMKGAEKTETRQRALQIAKHVFHMLTTVVPTAKRQPFAADNLADFAIVSFSEVPVSLANAFEKPVERAHGGGYLEPSEVALAEYWQRLNQAYGLHEQAAAFCFDATPWKNASAKGDDTLWPKDLRQFDVMSQLEAWIENDGSEKE